MVEVWPHFTLPLYFPHYWHSTSTITDTCIFPLGFTLKNPSCKAAGCPFSGPAKAGRCTGNPGTLSDAEIREIIAAGAHVEVDQAAAVNIVTWDNDQWVILSVKLSNSEANDARFHTITNRHSRWKSIMLTTDVSEGE